jgi:hypothetical protein
VEGSIVEAYLIEEVSDFCSTYFARDVSTRATRPDRHSDETRSLKETRSQCTIFDYPGRGRGPGYRYLNDKEFRAAQMFMLLNCSEIDELCGEYEATLDSRNIPSQSRGRIREEEMIDWMKQTIIHDRDRQFSTVVRNICLGAINRVTTYNSYNCNGYRYHTESYGEYLKTRNSGVCVVGENDKGENKEYFGILEAIYEMSYPFVMHNSVVLFKCRWFDPVKGVRVLNPHGIIEVKHTSSITGYDPFIFAHQAKQVYYMPYPLRTIKDRRDWWVVTKTKPKFVITEVDDEDELFNPDTSEYFQEENMTRRDLNDVDRDERVQLHVPGVLDPVNNEELHAQPMESDDEEDVEEQIYDFEL